MIDAVEYFSAVMKLPEIVTLLGNDDAGEPKVYWALAEIDATLPFLVFSIEDEGPISKGSDRMKYRATARVFAEDLTSVVKIGSAIRAAVKDQHGSRVYDRGAKADYTDPEAKEAFMAIYYEYNQ